MEVSMTYGQGKWDQQFHQTVLFRNGETENRVINLYPEITYQTFEGFGGAITDAAGYVYSQMNDAQKKALMDAYFSPDRMNYQFVRIPIDSCDFSLNQYEASSKPDLSDFQFERVEKYILPMLDDAEKAAGRRLKLVLSPWSPPAWMKTNKDRAHGGRLKMECYSIWAEYLCRYIGEYKSRGYHVATLTLQNEAKAVQTWDSCVFTAQEEKTFLKDFMWPAMERHDLTDIQVYLWDHNKERVWEWMRDIIDEETDPMIAGAAFHWYSGDHFEALDLCREKFPDKQLIVSESCIEFSKFDASDASGAALRLSHELAGDLNHGISAFIDWNLLLDEQGGPNYVNNFCLAPFLYDTKAQRLLPQLLSQYFEHFARALVPGAVRVAISRYAGDIEATAWKWPDGTLALVMLNQSEEIRPVCVRLNDQEADLILYPRSILSARIRES
ncbi:MAG: glucosylceramidase [Clostridia bacterium]|nr:glucosylceramidase [Clostridia bacterium]